MSAGLGAVLLRSMRVCAAGVFLLRAATASGLVWSYPSPTNGWTPKTVSIGQDGTQVLMQCEGYGGFTRLLSAFDSAQPTPVWQDPGPYYMSECITASSKSTNVHATIQLAQVVASGPTAVEVEKYTSNSSVPNWTYTFPFGSASQADAVYVTPDGSRIVAWAYNAPTMNTQVCVFASSSPVPILQVAVDLIGVPLSAALSGDGTALLLGSTMRSAVVDTTTGSVSFLSGSMLASPMGQSISGDGQTVARARQAGSLDVYRKQGGAYQYLTSFAPGTNGFVRQSALDWTGSTLAIGWIVGPPFLEAHVRVIDVTGTSFPVLYEDTILGQGMYSLDFTDMRITPDGTTLAVSDSGDQLGFAPEVLAYRRTGTSTWSRILAWDLPGSALALDLSSDGDRLVVGSKSVHMNQIGSGGEVDLFDLDSPDVQVLDVPHVGVSMRIQQTLPPGTPCRLLAATAPATAPITFPNDVGTLYLNRTLVHPVSFGSTDASGQFTTTISLTGPSFQVGTTMYYQGLSLAPRRLSGTWLAVTVLP